MVTKDGKMISMKVLGKEGSMTPGTWACFVIPAFVKNLNNFAGYSRISRSIRNCSVLRYFSLASCASHILNMKTANCLRHTVTFFVGFFAGCYNFLYLSPCLYFILQSEMCIKLLGSSLAQVWFFLEKKRKKKKQKKKKRKKEVFSFFFFGCSQTISWSLSIALWIDCYWKIQSFEKRKEKRERDALNIEKWGICPKKVSESPNPSNRGGGYLLE